MSSTEISPRLEVSIPILMSADFDVTLGFYGHMGFGLRWRWPDYLLIARDGVELHFLLQGQNPREPRTAYVRVAQGIDALFELSQGLPAEARITGLNDQFYLMREFSLRDPDGNVVHYGQELPQAQ